MARLSGPLYEVAFFVAPEIVEAFEERVEEHVKQALLDPAVTDITLVPRGDDDRGRRVRLCLYSLARDEAVDDFIDGTAGDFESRLRAEFGENVGIETRVLREDRLSDRVQAESPDCLNCGAHLRGQYCGHCGQRARSRLISLWELVSDAFGDLFEIDSRLWQTLIPLLVSPGKLTYDYLQGKRARFMPPFRMYLVLSLLFFVVAFFDPREQFSLLFEPEPAPTPEEIQQNVDEAAAARDAAQDKIDELIEKGVIDEDDVSANLRISAGGVRFTTDDDADGSDGGCDVETADFEDLPDWFTRRLTPERIERICERTRLDNGKALANNLLDNIPAALIVLLPLMAFVLKALYPLSKRYYVEHLLFFVHFHAFFFLILTLQIVFWQLGGLVGIPEAIRVLTIVATSFYIAIYLFVAMRKVYGQGRIITFLKYIALLVAYLFGFTATMLGALAIAMFSI